MFTMEDIYEIVNAILDRFEEPDAEAMLYFGYEDVEAVHLRAMRLYAALQPYCESKD